METAIPWAWNLVHTLVLFLIVDLPGPSCESPCIHSPMNGRKGLCLCTCRLDNHCAEQVTNKQQLMNIHFFIFGAKFWKDLV